MTEKVSNKPIRSDEFNKGWLWFEQEILYAKHYNLLPNLSGILPGLPPQNPILDNLLPGLLFIKAMSLLDEGLAVKINNVQLEFNERLKRPDLFHRIEYLHSHNLISNASELHELRKRRQVLAHSSECCSSWEDLVKVVSIIRNCLQKLEIIGEVPHFTIMGEHSKIRESQDPNAAWERTLRVYILDGDKMVSEISSVEKTMQDDS